MKTKILLFIAGIMFFGCTNNKNKVNIIFLHHSIGQCIWDGQVASVDYEIFSKASTGKRNSSFTMWMKAYNKSKNTNYKADDLVFPKNKPYGWNNFPYDYYNIWVKNAGNVPYKEEPTLELLTKDYNVIILKHCYPCSNLVDDSIANIDSDIKSIGNYKLQYEALKEKMKQFPKTKFIIWTGAAQVKGKTSEAEALRAAEFFDWVKSDWDDQNDNIYIWDFRALETEGDLYLKEKYAISPTDSHPNKEFSERVVKLFGQRVVDVIENSGTKTNLKGELL